jgi:hypothetical protein
MDVVPVEQRKVLNELPMSIKIQSILQAIIHEFDSDNIGLPSAPPCLLESSQPVDHLMEALQVRLGAIAESDYFKCSRDRFSHILRLALESLPQGCCLLDIGKFYQARIYSSEIQIYSS